MKRRIIILFIGGILMFGLFGCKKAQDNDDNSIKKSDSQKAELVAYRNSSGGGMNGGGSSVEISIINEEVYLTFSSSEWWYEDSAVTEYKIDRAALEEINAIFTKYKMKKWDKKTFSNLEVMDGENYSYSFTFDDKTSISFSSQYYPDKYSTKLDEISEVIKKYRDTGELEPKLLKRNYSEEEYSNLNTPDNGLVKLDAYEYSKNRLNFRVLNGTDEEISLKKDIRLLRNSDSMVMGEESSDYVKTIGAHSSTDISLRLNSRLEEGSYTLIYGDYSAEIKIGFSE